MFEVFIYLALYQFSIKSSPQCGACSFQCTTKSLYCSANDLRLLYTNIRFGRRAFNSEIRSDSNHHNQYIILTLSFFYECMLLHNDNLVAMCFLLLRYYYTDILADLLGWWLSFPVLWRYLPISVPALQPACPSISSNERILNELRGVEPGWVEIIPLNRVTVQVRTWLLSAHTTNTHTVNRHIYIYTKCVAF